MKHNIFGSAATGLLVTALLGSLAYAQETTVQSATLRSADDSSVVAQRGILLGIVPHPPGHELLSKMSSSLKFGPVSVAVSVLAVY